MSTNMQILIAAVVILLIVGAAAWWFTQRRKRSQLREQFGPEYGRAVEQHGDRGRAESALHALEERVQQLHIRPFPPEEAQRFAGSWQSVQARFVDDPAGAIREADQLVSQAMEVRGYPMGDFEQKAADISVDHPDVVEHYRAAHAIAERHVRQNGSTDGSTEDLRQAMVHYRALFEDLLGTQARQPTEVPHG